MGPIHTVCSAWSKVQVSSACPSPWHSSSVRDRDVVLSFWTLCIYLTEEEEVEEEEEEERC